MTIYTLLLYSFYYDGESPVLDEVQTELHNFSTHDKAKAYMEECVKEELLDTYTADMLTRDGDNYAVFKNAKNDILYRLTINERELDDIRSC